MKVSLKKWCIALSVLPTLFACDSFDDRELWNAVNSLDGRVTAIEKQLETMNNDVYSLSVMIAALRDNVYVTEVVRGSGGGYELRLSDGSKIVIADGKDGEISDFPITTYEEWLYP